MIVLRVDFNGSLDPQPEFVAEVRQIGQTTDEREVLALWVRALDHPNGIRRLRDAVREECKRKGIPIDPRP